MNSENTKPVIFLAFANEREDELNYLCNLTKEAENIRDALDSASKEGLCEIFELPNATLHEIFDVFQKQYPKRVAIFHYGGHSNGYQLLLESEKGLTGAYAEGLAAFMGQQDCLQLVFLNGCATQKQAQGLNDAGISIVIATSRDIDDRVAMEFARCFYNGLGGGANIQKAFNEAKARIWAEHGKSPRNLYCAGKRDKDLAEDRWPWDLYLRPGAESTVQWSLPEAAKNPLFGLPPVPEQDLLPPSPFRYLSWFAREHAEIFFGRGYEIRDLYQRATDPNSDPAPIILFYGQAGVGKSSVLAAGLLPRLERSHEILYLRRDFKKGLLGTLLEGLSENQGMTLAESWLDRERQNGEPLVIILDQVEEAFTRPSLDLPNELPDFWNALQAIFGNSSLRPKGKLILGFRKEWLAETDKQLTDRKLPFSRVPLEHLSRRGIIEAVIGTYKSDRLQQYYGLEVEDGLPEIIADDLLEDRESSVAPTLQILLTKMWEKASEKDKKHPVFDLALYQTLKKKGILLKDFLDQQLVALEKWNSEVINSGLAFDLLAFHTTPLGTAEERTEEQIQHTYKHQSQVINLLIQECVDLHLLERLSEAVTRLSHDILAPLVRHHFTASDKPGQRARRILESRAAEWQDDQQGTPLDESDLSLVEKGENGMRAWETDEERLVKVSREKRGERRRNKRILYGMGIVAILAILILAGVANYQKQIAEEQTKEVRASDLNFKSSTLSQDPITLDKSILLAIESFRISRTSEAEQLIRQGLLLPRLVADLNHDDWVDNAVFSPDGKYVATASIDNTARLWNAATGIPIFVLNHDGPVNKISFSSDGKYVATTIDDKTARVWDVATGKQIFVLRHVGGVSNVVFSPDGKYIATASDDNTARVWDAATGKQILILNHSGGVTDVVFSPDGKYISTASRDKTARVWDVATGKPIFAPLKHDHWVRNVVFSPDGKYVATASLDKTARVWDAATGKQIFVLNHDDQVSNVVFSPDGKYIATASYDNTARLWYAATGKQIFVLNHNIWVSKVVFSPDGKYVATVSDAKAVHLWDAATGKQIFNLNHDGQVDSVVFSPDGNYVATASMDNTSRIWDAATGKQIFVQNHTNWVNNVVFSPDGKYVATASWDKTARLWDVSTGKQIFVLNHDDDVRNVVFSPDEKYVATASMDNTSRIWDAATGKQIFVLNHNGSVWNVVFSPDGNYVATVSLDNTSRIWNATTGKQIFVLNHNDSVRNVVFSPDGKYVATASDDKTARIWDAVTGKQIFVLNHDDWVNNVVFSSDGKYVATASLDKTARVWDAATGKQIFVLNHDDIVDNVVFSPDGKYVAWASGDTARLYIFGNIKDLINDAGKRLTRNLNEDEWKKYMGNEPYHKTFPNLP